MQDEEWRECLRKVLMAFFCLAGKVKKSKRAYLVDDIDINALYIAKLDVNENTSRDKKLHISDDSDTTLRRTKKVTFHENVIKRHPSLESADNCSINVTLYDKEEIEISPTIEINGECIQEFRMNDYQNRNGYLKNELDDFPPYSYSDYKKHLNERDKYVDYGDLSRDNGYNKSCSTESFDVDEGEEFKEQANGDISHEKRNSEVLEFVTFHSHLNAEEYSPKKNFRFPISSPRSRPKSRDHNNNNKNNSNGNVSVASNGSVKKINKDPEYWQTEDINTLERKRANRLASSSFRKDKPLNPFSRTKSAGNLSGGSFRNKLISKFASLNLKQEPQLSSTPGPSPSAKRTFSLKRRSSFNSKLESKPGGASEETLASLSISNTSLDDTPMNFGIAARKLHEHSQYHTFDSTQTNSIGQSSTFNKESLSRKEIKDLNSLLTLFDMDKVTSSSSDDEVISIKQQPLNHYVHEKQTPQDRFQYDEKQFRNNSQHAAKTPPPSNSPYGMQTPSTNSSYVTRTPSTNASYLIRTPSTNSSHVNRTPSTNSSYVARTNSTNSSHLARTNSIDSSFQKQSYLPLDNGQSLKENTDNKSTGDDALSNRIPDDLSEVLNELLSVGNPNTSTVDPSTENFTLSRQNTLTKRSIENFFDRNNIFREVEKFEGLQSEGSNSNYSNYSSDSESCFEIDDSGIDETMPGLTREHADTNKTEARKHSSHDHGKSKSKRKSEHGHRRRKHHGERKHKHDGDENGNSTIRRSHSEPRKSSRKDANGRSDSVPRSSTYSTDKDDKDKRDQKSRGRQKEKRSEPPVPARPNNYTKSRRSEPIVTNRVRNENDIEGGAVGVYKRTQTAPISFGNNKLSPNKNVKLSVKTNGEVNASNNMQLKRNNSVQLSPKAREYMWDTADGKHRVYVRSKEEKAATNSKFISGSPTKKNVKNDDIADELGLSPELVDMLKEEEKFWQKQQELKYWRKSRDQAEDNEYIRPQRDRETSFERREKMRELEENRLEREASLFMKVRAEQEYALKTSRENLLNDNVRTNQQYYQNNHGKTYQQQYNVYRDVTDTANSFNNDPLYDEQKDYIYIEPLSRHSELSRHYPRREVLTSSGYKSSSTASPRDLDDDTYSAGSPRSPVYHNGYSSATTEVSHRPSSYEQRPSPYEQRPSPYEQRPSSYEQRHHHNKHLQSGCFSDDDEVFYNRKENRREHNRGYYSDHDSQLIGRVYNARPMINSQRLHIICTACTRVVSDERLMTSDIPHYFWHLKCFYCVVCRSFLNDSHAVRVRVVDHKLHCRYCFSAQNGEQLSEV